MFAAEKKRPPPYPPRCVGFVTSPTGAAIQDFISVLKRRDWTGRLIVFPAKVQGAGAAAEIAAQIRKAGSLGILDTLVVGRGGGSLEDLWAFNEEPVARAVAACPVPVISAVGHEIDFTLCDFAADRRAETPTAAAELVTSMHIAARDRLDIAGEAIHEAVQVAMEALSQRLDFAESRLGSRSPITRLRHDGLRLSVIENRMQTVARGRIAAAHRTIDLNAHALAGHTPHARVIRARDRTDALARALDTARTHRLAALAPKLDNLEARLRATGIDATLRRGFALVENLRGGDVLSSAGAVTPGLSASLCASPTARRRPKAVGLPQRLAARALENTGPVEQNLVAPEMLRKRRRSLRHEGVGRPAEIKTAPSASPP